MAQPLQPVQSQTDVANIALAHCSVSKPIGNLDTEQSTEAQILRTVYMSSVLEVLRSVPWNFAKKFATPATVAGPNPQATIEWMYAYRYPSDCIHFLRFISLRLKNDTRQSRVPFTIGADNQGMLIYTDWPGSSALGPVTIEYTFLNTNLAQWPADFVEMLALLLAVKIIRPLTGGDPFGLRPQLVNDLMMAHDRAASMNMNEEQRPEEPVSEFERARNYETWGITGTVWQATPSGVIIQ